MLNGFQSRINKRNEKYFMQFLFFICTTKPSVSSHIHADRHSFHTIINNHWEFQHSKKLVGNKHIENLPGFVYLSLFHSTFFYRKSTGLTLLKEPLSNNSRMKKRSFWITFFNKLKADQNRAQYSHDIWNFISQILLWEKKGKLSTPLWLSHFGNSSLECVPTKDFIWIPV